MNDQVIITAIYAGSFLLLFSLGEILFHFLKVKAELTRKFVHVITGFICLTFPLFITTHWSVLFLTICFALILSISMKYNFLKSINAVDRKTSGSYLFPVSIYLTYWAYAFFGHGSTSGSDIVWTSEKDFNAVLSNTEGLYYFLPLLIFSISDPLAALVGKKWPLGKYQIFNETKTLAGSGAFFLSALGISFLFLVNQNDIQDQLILIAFLMALFTTLAEGISQKGFDNLFVPAVAILILVIFK